MKAKYYLKDEHNKLIVIEHDGKDGWSPEEIIETLKDQYKTKCVLYIVEGL